MCVVGLDEGHQHTRVHLTCLFLAGVGAGGFCASLEAGAYTPSEGLGRPLNMNADLVDEGVRAL